MKRIEAGLSLAAAKGHDIILQLLLEYNPNLEARNENDKTPLFRAVDCDHYEIVTLLRRERANVNAVAKNGWTELSRARESQCCTRQFKVRPRLPRCCTTELI